MVCMQSPSKRFKISAFARKSRIIDYVKKIWLVRHVSLTQDNVDPPVIMSDQMPLHLNEWSNIKTMNFSGQVQITYVKEIQTFPRDNYCDDIGCIHRKNSSKLRIRLQGKNNLHQTESSTKCYSSMGPERILPVPANSSICK